MQDRTHVREIKEIKHAMLEYKNRTPIYLTWYCNVPPYRLNIFQWLIHTYLTYQMTICYN